MHGQELASEIEKRKGIKPSPGTIYPALKSLKEDGFIREHKQGKTVIYRLTPNGERALKVAKQRFCSMFMDVLAP